MSRHNRRSASQARDRVTRVAAADVLSDDATSVAFRICRVDEEHREVWGYAVSGELGWDGKVLPHQANVAAFGRWMDSEFGGNVREMHRDEAVGRVFHWEADDESERILVGVQISEGAPTTWAKICEGVLRAFSVDGRARPGKARTVMFTDRAGVTRSVRQFDEWDMNELSVVDAPGDRGVGAFTNVVRSLGGDVIQRAREAAADAAALEAHTEEAEMGAVQITVTPEMTPAEIGEAVTRALEAAASAPVLTVADVDLVPPAADAPATDDVEHVDEPAEPLEGEPPAGEETATRDVTSALAEAQRTGVTAEDERTDAQLALDAIAIIDLLVAREALEQAASGESEAWDIELLNDARIWLSCFANGELSEANAMVTRMREGAPMNDEERQVITDLAARLQAVETSAAEGVQRAETQLGEAVQTQADLVTRVAALEALPADGGPLRTVPDDFTDPSNVERVLRRLKDEMPSSASEIDQLLTMHQIRDAQSRPVTGAPQA